MSEEMSFRDVDPGGEELAEINRNLVPIKLALPLATTSDERPEPLLVTVIQLDVTRRPDVADLMRVIRVDGIGQGGKGLSATLYTSGPTPGVVYKFALEDPASCSFNIFLRWPVQQQALERMAELGYFYLLTSEPGAPVIQGGVVVINGPELAGMIETWRTLDL